MGKRMVILALGLLAGCTNTQDHAFVGTGADELPPSACQACDKEPFYRGGQWVTR